MSTILVCGSRDLKPSPWVYTNLAAHIHPWDIVITGGAPGADTIAICFARGIEADVMVFPADWANEGRAAGPKRNARMLAEGKPDFVLAFPGGRGTADMVRRAKAAGVPVVEVGDE